MSSRRLLKAAEAVREVVSMAILTSVRDPRVKDVTVTRVEMAADMKSATVHVSVMGGVAAPGYVPPPAYAAAPQAPAYTPQPVAAVPASGVRPTWAK